MRYVIDKIRDKEGDYEGKIITRRKYFGICRGYVHYMEVYNTRSGKTRRKRIGSNSIIDINNKPAYVGISIPPRSRMPNGPLVFNKNGLEASIFYSNGLISLKKVIIKRKYFPQ